MNDDPHSSPPSVATGADELPSSPIELDVMRLTRRGEGLAMWSNRPVFVPHTDAGERVRVSLSDVRGRLRGHVVDVLERSPHRRDPACPHAHHCPGCQVRHLTDARQTALSMGRVRDHIHAATGTTVDWRVIAKASRDGARSRVVARALWDASGQLALGMAATDDGVVALSGCAVQSTDTRDLLGAVQDDLRAAGLPPYDPRTRVGSVRHVFAEASPAGARVVIALAHAVPDERFEGVLADRAHVSLSVDVLPKRGAGTFSAPRPLRGRLSLTLAIDGDPLRATLPAWTPQAPETVPALRRTLVDWLAPTRDDHIVEVGCGIGTLSLPLARRCHHLTGIDRCRAAISDAQHNARVADVHNTQFVVGDGLHALRRLLAKGVSADLMVLHTMRRALGPAVMSAVRALDPRRIVYLAPNPSALADDLRNLLGHDRPAGALSGTKGYVMSHAGVVDQSPGTTDLLAVVALERAMDPHLEDP